MDFLGLFFVSLTALGTSSLRLIVFPRGVGCTGFADWYRGVVSYTNDDLGKASGLIDIELMNMVPRKRLTMGWEDDTLGAGRCPVSPPPWLVMAGRSGRWCQLLCFFLIFWKSMVIDGWETCFVCCRGQWRPPGWEVDSTVLSETLFLLRHRSNCGYYWCSHVVRKGGRTSP